MAKVRNPGDPIPGKTTDEWKKTCGDGWKHVEYERSAFLVHYALFPRIADGGDLTEIVGLRNAVYEATMVHFRNLCDFFSPPTSRQDDDIVAGDFVPGWAHTFSDVIEDARSIVNKQIVHMSYFRNALPEKLGQKLPWATMTKEVNDTWEQFTKSLGPARLLSFHPELTIGTSNTSSTEVVMSFTDFDPKPPPRKK